MHTEDTRQTDIYKDGRNKDNFKTSYKITNIHLKLRPDITDFGEKPAKDIFNVFHNQEYINVDKTQKKRLLNKIMDICNNEYLFNDYNTFIFYKVYNEHEDPEDYKNKYINDVNVKKIAYTMTLDYKDNFKMNYTIFIFLHIDTTRTKIKKISANVNTNKLQTDIKLSIQHDTIKTLENKMKEQEQKAITTEDTIIKLQTEYDNKITKLINKQRKQLYMIYVFFIMLCLVFALHFVNESNKRYITETTDVIITNFIRNYLKLPYNTE